MNNIKLIKERFDRFINEDEVSNNNLNKEDELKELLLNLLQHFINNELASVTNKKVDEPFPIPTLTDVDKDPIDKSVKSKSTLKWLHALSWAHMPPRGA